MSFLLFFSTFCLVLGLLLLIIRGKYFAELRRENFFSGLFIGLGFVFILLSLFGLLGGFAEKINGVVPCELVVHNTSTGMSNTTYEYINTCDYQTPLQITNVLYNIYLWVLFFIGILTIGGSAYLLINWFKRF